MSTSCNVCATDFNKSSNIKITCFKCDFECCRKCVKTYMLSKNENAHCMSCKIEWDRKFLTDNLDNLFMTKTYKEHRESVCFDRELGMLQGTQVYVEKAIKLETLKNELKETKTLIAELKLKQINLEREILVENQTKVLTAKKFVRRCPNGDCLGFLSTSLKCELCEVFACSECHEIKGKTTQEKESHQCKPEVIESVKMIESDSKPCPTCSSLIFKIEGCFAKDTPILMWDQSVKMSQDIIPGDLLIGDDNKQRQVLDTCSGEDNMYEIKQEFGETYVVNSKHTLVLKNEKGEEIEIMVEDYLKLADDQKKLLYGFKCSFSVSENSISSISVKLLGKGTYYGWRLDGNHRFIAPDFTVLRNCHQMYCVCCHTAFDWQTLRIETGQIHNPEYFEYLRKKGSLERNPDEVLCGRELDHHLYLKVLSRVSNENYVMQEQLQNIMEKAMHIRFEEQPRFRRDRLNNNIDLRIMYMRNQIDKDKFKMLLQKREKESSKCNEIHNVLVMFTNCLTEILYRIQPDTLRENIIECDELRKYTNDCLTRISKTYKSKEYVINRLYNFT
jgi:hypothetical protein